MIGSIISGISGIAGLVGGMKGGKTESAPVQGYATYPQWLKDLYEKTFAPAVTEEFKKEYEAIPMTRYESVDPFFGSAQLRALQQMSDKQGGMFSPYVDPNAPPKAAVVDDAAKAQELADMEARMIARQYLGQFQGQPSMFQTTQTAKDAQMRDYVSGQINNDPSKLSDLGKYVQGIEGLGGIKDINEREKKQLELEMKYKDYALPLTGRRYLMEG